MGKVSVFEILLVSLVLLTNVILIWATLTRAKNKLLGLSFAIFIAAVTLWIGSAFLSEVSHSINQKLILTKVAYMGVILSFPSLIKFLGLLQSKVFIEKGWLMKILSVISLFLALFTLLTNKIISGINLLGTSFDIYFGQFYSIFIVYALLYGILIFYLLLRGYLGSSGEQRYAYRLVVMGIAVFTVINILVNIVIPVLTGSQEFYRYGNYSVVFFTSLSTYSIVAHKLFEIRTFTTATAMIAINILLISKLFLSEGLSDFLINILLLVGVGVGSVLLVGSVSKEISRRREIEELAKEKTETLRELEQKNKNLAALQKISEVVLNENDMKVMTQKILDELPKQLEACAGGMLSIVKNGQLVSYAMSSNQYSNKILSLIGGSLEKYSYPIRREFNQTHNVLVERKSKDSESLADFISPPIPKTMALTIQKMIGVRHIESFPLYAGGEPFGVMTFVFTEKKEQIHEKNYSIAKAISDDMSLAIQRAQAFQKLKEANEYLAELDKMKDEFISIASHELNTPLAAIEGYLSMILDEGMGKVDPKAKEYLRRAYDSSKRLADLILDLLNVSRIEQGRLKVKFSETSLSELAQSVIHELQLKASTKKIYLKLEAPKELPKSFLDPDRIREVFVNLIGNSIKFTEKGGITVKITHPDDHLRVEIIDTGRGIAEEDMKKLFHKFSQVKREVDEHQGTGLGLYISKNFVELHKGTIGVTSTEGKGSTFMFELPILKQAPKAVPGAILEQPIGATQIESGDKGVPEIVKVSTKT